VINQDVSAAQVGAGDSFVLTIGVGLDLEHFWPLAEVKSHPNSPAKKGRFTARTGHPIFNLNMFQSG
jgi:hypothetical protein